MRTPARRSGLLVGLEHRRRKRPGFQKFCQSAVVPQTLQRPLRLPDVGDKVGNTEGTVRATLKRIHDNLGLTRQADLALLVAKASAFSATGAARV